MNDRQTICRKIQIYPVGDKDEVDRVYKFIRNGIYTQYKGMNLLMGQLASQFYSCGMNLQSTEFKEWQKKYMTNSNPIFDDLEFAQGVDTKSAITQKVKQDLTTAIKNGLCKGERNINNYRRTTPLITRGRSLIFEYRYENYTEFMKHFYDRDLDVMIKWVNKIKFKIIFGNPKKSNELRCVIKNILEENYQVQGSSIEIDDNKIILNLSLSIPKQIHKLDEEVVVGVDLGVAIPAVCGLNCNKYSRQYIGSQDDFSE